jgi:hydrogenase nickel incorporation protein HypB
MFAASRLMVLNKIDLLPHVRFDVDRCIAFARRVNPAIEVLQLSATTGEGMDAWLHWLDHQMDQPMVPAHPADHPHHAEAQAGHAHP